MRRYDVYEPGGRLMVARSRAATLADISGLVALFLLGIPGLLWALSLFAEGRSARSRLWFLGAAALAVAAALYAFLLLLRAYRAQRLRELLVLDRAADAVTRGDQRLCALAELAGVELRRRPGRNDEGPWYHVGLVVAGLRPRDAPRGAPSAFEDAIPVGDSASEEEMRACASRIAAYAGVPLEEKGF
jgi:hypothetical protein